MTLGRADLQVHTTASDGMDDAEAMIRAAAAVGLDCIAVTEHDDVGGGLAARELGARLHLGVEVIPGVEVTTRAGHLLALWVEQPVPSLGSLPATVEAVWAQGGVCVIPHPMSWFPLGIGRRATRRLLAAYGGAAHLPGVLAIELANPMITARWHAAAARAANRSWRLAETGGSDAHFVERVGGALTRYPGRSAADLRAALEAGLTVAEMGPPIPLSAPGWGRVARQPLRGLMATPRALARRSLAAVRSPGAAR